MGDTRQADETAPVDWWVLGNTFCCWVRSEGDTITDTAPILRRFKGQPLKNLDRWRHVRQMVPLYSEDMKENSCS